MFMGFGFWLEILVCRKFSSGLIDLLDHDAEVAGANRRDDAAQVALQLVARLLDAGFALRDAQRRVQRSARRDQARAGKLDEVRALALDFLALARRDVGVDEVGVNEV